MVVRMHLIRLLPMVCQEAGRSANTTQLQSLLARSIDVSTQPPAPRPLHHHRHRPEVLQLHQQACPFPLLPRVVPAPRVEQLMTRIRPTFPIRCQIVARRMAVAVF